MKDARPLLILWLFSFVPYVAVSWVFMKLTDGDTGDFWVAFAVLLVARAFFALIETLGGVLTWRAYGRRLVVDRQLEFLRTNGFPPRASKWEDFVDYMNRIENDEQYPEAIRTAARESRYGLMIHESLGGLRGMRMHSAAEAALEAYSPKSRAPEYEDE